MFSGYMRKVVFPLVAMVALGWLLVVIGFGIETTTPFNMGAGGSIRYSWWMVILVTPISIIAAVAQAAVDKNRLAMNILGSTMAFFSALLLTALGFLLNYYGSAVNVTHQAVDFIALQFSGAFITTLFWVGVMCVSYFYERDGDLVN